MKIINIGQSKVTLTSGSKRIELGSMSISEDIVISKDIVEGINILFNNGHSIKVVVTDQEKSAYNELVNHIVTTVLSPEEILEYSEDETYDEDDDIVEDSEGNKFVVHDIEWNKEDDTQDNIDQNTEDIGELQTQLKWAGTDTLVNFIEDDISNYNEEQHKGYIWFDSDNNVIAYNGDIYSVSQKQLDEAKEISDKAVYSIEFNGNNNLEFRDNNGNLIYELTISNTDENLAGLMSPEDKQLLYSLHDTITGEYEDHVKSEIENESDNTDGKLAELEAKINQTIQDTSDNLTTSLQQYTDTAIENLRLDLIQADETVKSECNSYTDQEIDRYKETQELYADNKCLALKDELRTLISQQIEKLRTSLENQIKQVQDNFNSQLSQLSLTRSVNSLNTNNDENTNTISNDLQEIKNSLTTRFNSIDSELQSLNNQVQSLENRVDQL